jgi:small subunit ribosomal protein S14
MSYSNWKKAFKQLKAKPVKLKKYKKHNSPAQRSCGRSKERCSRCGRIRGHISSYSLDLCRQCFRQIAPKIGFKKFS